MSVIVAFHNDAGLVAGALAQLAALRYPDLEVVLVDDGSTDATATLLDELSATLPAVTVLRNPVNVGVAVSRNRALAEATGEWVWFADSDDRWDAGILDVLVGAIEGAIDGAIDGGIAASSGSRHDIVVCGARVDGSDRTIDAVDHAVSLGREEALAQLLTGDLSGYLWTKLFRRALLTDFPDQRSLSDLPFVAAAIAASSAVARVPGLPYTYVQRSGSITSSAGVNLDDLARAASTVLEVAKDAPAGLATTFRYWCAVVPCHTQWALRSEPARARVAGLDVRARVRDIRLVAAHDRRTALKALWIRAAGPLFAPTYRLITRGRGHG